MKISSNAHMYRIPFKIVTGPGQSMDRFVNVFVLLGTRTWIVDTGVAGSESKLLAELQAIGRRPETIERILLTHGHVDHIGAAKSLRDATGAHVYAHPAERSWIETVEIQAKERPVPGFHQLVGGSVTIDHALHDNESFQLDPHLNLRVIHSPGHSPGSTSFFLEEQGLLFAGDAVPVPGDMPVYDNPLASIDSLLRLQSLNGMTTLLSAWDEVRTGPAAQAALNCALELIDRIHVAVRTVSRSVASPDPVTLCRETLKELSLPEAMANPLVARTFLGHYALRDRERLR